MHSTYIELKDIIDEISTQSEDIEFNPVRLDEVNGRLNLIYSLEQKHRVQTVEELVRLTEGIVTGLPLLPPLTTVLLLWPPGGIRNIIK